VKTFLTQYFNFLLELNIKLPRLQGMMEGDSFRYLMAESDPLDVEIFSSMLISDSGPEVIVDSTTNYQETYQALRKLDYAALIIDIALPGIQGKSTIERVLARFPTLPVVVLTGEENQQLAVECLHLGVQDYIAKSQLNSEILKRIMRYAIERKQIDLQLKMALRESAEKNLQLQTMARTDALTSLPNRVAFYEMTAQALASAKRMKKSLGILYFDLNGFKQVNDTLGHTAGDQVLVTIGQRLKNKLRNSDTVARMGGDEFVVLTNILEDPSQSYSVARKLNETICEPMLIDEHEVRISASIGIATYPEVKTVESLVQCADMAMYEAKQSRQHFACFYTKHLENKQSNQRKIETALDGAISNNEIHATFQPIYSLANSVDSSSSVSAEVLCRWFNENMGEVDASKFIPVAEASAIADPLSNFMLREIKNLADACKNESLQIEKFCLNVFGRQFLSPKFGNRLISQMQTVGLEPKLLCLELGEAQLLTHMEACYPQLEHLQSQGVRIALDNFGTGGSSMNQLKRMPINYLKLDRSLTSYIDQASENQAIADGIIHMAHRLGIKIVAEGIERVEEYHALAALGCDEFQGYLFGYPMMKKEIMNHWQNFKLPAPLTTTPSFTSPIASTAFTQNSAVKN
jgi:diguanylate cyclase (GGDEF)-like protein